MKLRNKKTGGIWNIPKMRHPTIQEDGISFFAHNRDEGCLFSYKSIAELNEEWEDYEPVEPIFDEKIRRGIRAWWNMQDNPFKYAHVMLKRSDKDLDGFYHWIIFAYIRNGKERVSTDLEFRTKNLYDYNPNHDYSKEELCGEEEK